MLAPEWLGHRVVVRRRSGPSTGPAFTDALGDLLALSDSEVTVETRTGRVTFDRTDVVLARLVRPSTAAQLALESVAAKGWRARETVVNPDGWLLRADHGWTGRANSALPLRTARRPLDTVLSEVRAWYLERSLPARIQVPLPAAAALDRALDQRGWTAADDVSVLVSRLDLLERRAAIAPTDPGPVRVAAAPGGDWLEAYHYRGGPLPARAADLLTRHDRVAFLALSEGGAAADGPVRAIARAVVDGPWLGITALEVRPADRRRGLATAVMRAGAEWGRGEGAQRCYLQVGQDNRGALAFYAHLGFVTHHTYRYRSGPPS